MKSENFLALRSELSAIRNEFVDSPFGRIPKSIPRAEAAIERATSLHDKAALYTLLLSECVRARNYELHVHVLRRQIEDIPNDPLPLTSLANALAHEPSSTEEALALSAAAVALAKEQDRQVKHSLTCQARVALQVGAFQTFNDALRDLITDANVDREEDHKLEFDFLDHANASQIDQSLVTTYRALAREKNSR
jgi:hypothetical protein